jgi:hypothetical protein
LSAVEASNLVRLKFVTRGLDASANLLQGPFLIDERCAQPFERRTRLIQLVGCMARTIECGLQLFLVGDKLCRRLSKRPGVGDQLV